MLLVARRELGLKLGDACRLVLHRGPLRRRLVRRLEVSLRLFLTLAQLRAPPVERGHTLLQNPSLTLRPGVSLKHGSECVHLDPVASLELRQQGRR